MTTALSHRGNSSPAPRRALFFRVCSLLLVCLTFASPTLQRAATPLIWSGTTNKIDWNTKNNWTPASANDGPTANDSVSFNGTSTGRTAVLSANSAVLGISFLGNSAYSISTGSNTLTIGSAGLMNMSDAVQTVSGFLTLGADAAFTDAYAPETGHLVVNGTIDTNGHALTLAGDSTASVIGASIGGSGSLEKADNGTWLLSATNTFTGGTALSGGILTAGATNALGSGALTVDDGLLALNAHQTVSRLSGTGGTVHFGATGHTLTLAQIATTTYAGALSGGGNLAVTGGSGTFTLSGGVSLGSVSISAPGATLSFAGATASAAVTSLSASNGGTISLGTNNVFAGTPSLTLSGGTLASAVDQAFGGFTTLNQSLNTIAFGSGSNVLTFTSASIGSGSTIEVRNYNYSGGSGTRLQIPGLNSAQLAAFKFTGGLSGAYAFGTSFIVPANDPSAIPEPSTYAVAVALLALAAALRHHSRRLRTAAATPAVS